MQRPSASIRKPVHPDAELEFHRPAGPSRRSMTSPQKLELNTVLRQCSPRRTHRAQSTFTQSPLPMWAAGDAAPPPPSHAPAAPPPQRGEPGAGDGTSGTVRISIAHAIAPPAPPRDASPTSSRVTDIVRTVPLPPGPCGELTPTTRHPGNHSKVGPPLQVNLEAVVSASRPTQTRTRRSQADKRGLRLAAATAPATAHNAVDSVHQQVAEVRKVGIQQGRAAPRRWPAPHVAAPSQGLLTQADDSYCSSCGELKYDVNGFFCAYCGVRFA